MGKYRTPSGKTRYSIPKQDYLTAIHYSLRYPLWKQELDSMADTSRGIRYDQDRVQSSNNSDATFEAALRISESYAQSRVKLIDDLITLAADGMDYWLRLGVCYGLTYIQLKNKGMPCGEQKYYNMRRYYYYLLSTKI